MKKENVNNKEEAIISLIRKEFNNTPDAIEKIIKLYETHKNDDNSLDQKFCYLIPKSARLPSKGEMKYFELSSNKVNARACAEQWGSHKLFNIFLSFEGHQMIYLTELGYWNHTPMSPKCKFSGKYENPLSNETIEFLSNTNFC